MKVFTRIVVDMTSGQIEEAESFDYRGPIAQCKSGGSPPAAPAPIDPWEVIRAQVAGQPDVSTPFYDRVYKGDPAKGNYRVEETYDKDVLKQFNQRNDIANAMLGDVKSMGFDMPGRDGAKYIDDLVKDVGTDDSVAGRVNKASNLSDQRQGVTDQFLSASPDAPFDWTQDDSSRVQDAYWQKQKGLLDQAFGEQGERLDQKLANQGLPMGSEAYGEEMGRYEQGRSDAYTRAAQDAVQLGAQEDQRQFGQSLAERNQYFSDLGSFGDEESRRFGRDISELGALQGLEGQRFGQDVQGLGALGNENQRQYNMIASLMGMPGGGFIPTGGGGAIDPTQAYGLQQQGVNNQFNAAMGGYNANVASANSTNAGLMGLGGAGMMALALSDRRFKKDIVMIGELVPGINIYEFEYTFGSPRTVGVMADEVERVMPEAVITDGRGVKFVDYAKLVSGHTLQ